MIPACYLFPEAFVDPSGLSGQEIEDFRARRDHLFLLFTEEEQRFIKDMSESWLDGCGQAVERMIDRLNLSFESVEVPVMLGALHYLRLLPLNIEVSKRRRCHSRLKALTARYAFDDKLPMDCRSRARALLTIWPVGNVSWKYRQKDLPLPLWKLLVDVAESDLPHLAAAPERELSMLVDFLLAISHDRLTLKYCGILIDRFEVCAMKYPEDAGVALSKLIKCPRYCREGDEVYKIGLRKSTFAQLLPILERISEEDAGVAKAAARWWPRGEI